MNAATTVRHPCDQARAVNPLLTVLLGICSFEFVFVLFLFAGQYKADPRFDWIPYDATVFWGVINVAQGLLLVLNPKFEMNKRGMPVVLLGVVFALYAAASLAWSDGVDYGTYKVAYIGTICSWCLCAGALIISSSSVRLVRFFKSMFLFSTWMAIECTLYCLQTGQFGRLIESTSMDTETEYIGLGRVVGIGGLICASIWLFGRPPNWRLWSSRFTTLLLLAFFIASSALIGARAPVFAAVLAIGFVSLFVSRRRLSLPFLKVISGVVVVLLVCLLFVFGYERLVGEFPLVVRRFMAFTEASEYYDLGGQSYTRLDLFAEAFSAWLERPMIGHGIGSFSIIWESIDERLFPHNLILELLCELGLIGLVLFMAIPCAAWWLARDRFKILDMRLKALVIAFAAYAFANTMTSGDIPDNRVIFVAIGLLAFREAHSAQPGRQKLALGNRPISPKFSRLSPQSIAAGRRG